MDINWCSAGKEFFDILPNLVGLITLIYFVKFKYQELGYKRKEFEYSKQKDQEAKARAKELEEIVNEHELKDYGITATYLRHRINGQTPDKLSDGEMIAAALLILANNLIVCTSDIRGVGPLSSKPEYPDHIRTIADSLNKIANTYSK